MLETAQPPLALGLRRWNLPDHKNFGDSLAKFTGWILPHLQSVAIGVNQTTSVILRFQRLVISFPLITIGPHGTCLKTILIMGVCNVMARQVVAISYRLGVNT